MLPWAPITVPWHELPSARRRNVILPSTTDQSNVRPIRADTRGGS